jgi:hypothetical protein
VLAAYRHAQLLDDGGGLMSTTYRQSPLGGKEQATPTPPAAPSVSIGTFMDRLEQQGVTFDLVADELHVEVPLGALSEAQRHELAARRDEVEHLVRVALGPYELVVRVAEASPVQSAFGEAA